MSRNNNQYDYGVMARLIISHGCSSGYSEHDLVEWLPHFNARLLHLAKNEMVARQGERGTTFGLVISGNLQLRMHAANGSSCLMRVVRSGEFLGHSFLFQDKPLVPCDVVAFPECTVIALDVEAVRAWGRLPISKAFYFMISHHLSRSIIVAWQHSAVLAQATLVDRLMAYLTFRRAEDDTREIVLDGTLDDLADYLTCDRTSLSRAISQLCAAGRIARRGRGVLELLDSETERGLPMKEYVPTPGCTSPVAVLRNRTNNT